VVVERRREGDEDTAPTYRISIDAEEGGFPIKDMRIPMCWIQYYSSAVAVTVCSGFVVGGFSFNRLGRSAT